MTVNQYLWQWQQKTFRITYETIGQGEPILLLPAFSTVSSRSEIQEIAQLLGQQYQVVMLDWLGFGESDRPLLNYQPRIYQQLLQDFVKATFKEPIVVVAAGHATGYALHLAQQQPLACSKLVLIAPTWRGPLPTMGASKFLAGVVRQLVRSPILGQALYWANTTPSFLRLMYGRHVYINQLRLTEEFITKKRQTTQQPGARFAPAAFVTGKLDLVSDRTAFLNYFASLTLPILAIIADQAPPKSRTEMNSLTNLPNVQTQVLKGTLGLHEEFAADVAAEILTFLRTYANTPSVGV